MASENGKPAVAHYIASLAEELSRLARNNELDALAYILDMARLEADQVSKRYNGRSGIHAVRSRLTANSATERAARYGLRKARLG